MRLSPLAVCLLPVLLAGCSSKHNPVAAIAPDTVATYRVTFNATWSDSTHPVDFPIRAHFSGLIGATHGDDVEFWGSGALASPGIQAVAELGSKSPFDAEILAAIDSGTAQHLLSGDGIAHSPGSVTLDFEISARYPLVTLVSMIAPSPDWFVGVYDLPLREEGWVDSLTVDLRGWDAGTDDGATFLAMDAPSTPHVPITSLDTGPFLVNGEVPTLGTFTFVRQR